VISLPAASNVVRVGLPRLDDLLRLVGELVISRSRLDDLLQGSWNGAGVPVDALECSSGVGEIVMPAPPANWWPAAFPMGDGTP
jgi:hypothetical protein